MGVGLSLAQADRGAAGAAEVDHALATLAGDLRIPGEAQRLLRPVAARMSTSTRPAYYAVFFYDPDAIKLEIVHRP